MENRVDTLESKSGLTPKQINHINKICEFKTKLLAFLEAPSKAENDNNIAT